MGGQWMSTEYQEAGISSSASMVCVQMKDSEFFFVILHLVVLEGEEIESGSFRSCHL